MKTAITLIAATVVLVGALALTRPGYSVDEEFTVFAVRGIQASGLPILPSGLLYDRGIAYSYLVAGAQGAQGAEGVLLRARMISLISNAIAIWLAFKLVSTWTSANAALLASILVATSIPFWATATTGRFYASFLAVFLGLLLALSTLRTSCTLRTLCTIAALSALARWTHELAFLCAAIPALCWLLARGDRRRWGYATIAVVTGLVAGQAVILVLHAAAPSSGDTMVRRFFLWQVINLFERPGDRQFMIPIVVLVIGWIVAPRRAWPNSVVALSISAMILAYSIARATNSAPLSIALVQSVLVEGSRYPLDMFWHIYRTTPLTMLLALSGLGLRAAGAGGEWRFGERAAHGVWVGWVLWFGVIESGITTNYLLLPVSLMLVAIAIDLVAILITPGVPARRAFSDPSRPALAGVVVLMLLIARDHWRTGSLESARPTITGSGVEEIRAGLLPADRIVCTDELGCLMLIGRIDRWLALDDYVRERFLVRRGDGPVSGVYTGVPAAFRPNDLFVPFDSADVIRSLAQGRPLEAGALPDRVLIVDIFKEYPIGNSRSWLPKAIEEDGLQVNPLLETPQMRVLQVSPPERVVSRQPSP